VRSNHAELGAERFTFGAVIGNGKDAELGGEFGRCNRREANWGVQRRKIGG
jgi:hypothetical protein